MRSFLLVLLVEGTGRDQAAALGRRVTGVRAFVRVQEAVLQVVFLVICSSVSDHQLSPCLPIDF